MFTDFHVGKSKLTSWCSRQIRPPIYSMKQSKLRRRRVIRFAILYFVLFVIFLALAVAPGVIGKKVLGDTIFNALDGKGDGVAGLRLLQPWGLDNNNTEGKTETGTKGSGGDASATSTDDSSKLRLF